MSSTKFRAPTFSLVSSRRLPHCRSLLHTTLLKTKPISRMPRHRAQATELEKCCQFLIGSNDESLSVVAVCISNEDRLSVGINRCDAAPTPTGFAEIVSDNFRVIHAAGL